MKYLQAKDGVPAVQFGHITLNLSARFAATVAGVVMKLIIPERKKNNA